MKRKRFLFSIVFSLSFMAMCELSIARPTLYDGEIFAFVELKIFDRKVELDREGPRSRYVISYDYDATKVVLERVGGRNGEVIAQRERIEKPFEAALEGYEYEVKWKVEDNTGRDLYLGEGLNQPLVLDARNLVHAKFPLKVICELRIYEAGLSREEELATETHLYWYDYTIERSTLVIGALGHQAIVPQSRPREQDNPQRRSSSGLRSQHNFR